MCPCRGALIDHTGQSSRRRRTPAVQRTLEYDPPLLVGAHELSFIINIADILYEGIFKMQHGQEGGGLLPCNRFCTWLCRSAAILRILYIILGSRTSGYFPGLRATLIVLSGITQTMSTRVRREVSNIPEPRYLETAWTR